MSQNELKPLSEILDGEWTREEVQRIWREAPADRYDAIKDAHNAEKAALVKALRRAVDALETLDDGNFPIVRSDISIGIELRQITSILNQGRS